MKPEDFANALPSFKRRNPHFFGPVGGLQHSQPQQNPIPALEPKPKARNSRARRAVLGVEIISCRKGSLDEVNLCGGGGKAIQDAIAKELGVDDADPIVRWSFHQIKTDGRPGTIVKIQEL